MKKITYLNVFLTYVISLVIFFCVTISFHYLLNDKGIFKKMSLFIVSIALFCIVLWSALFSLWSTPRYTHKLNTIYSTNPKNLSVKVCDFLKRYNYNINCNSTDTLLTLSSKDPITNWFYGDITININDNNLKIECSNIIFEKLPKI